MTSRFAPLQARLADRTRSETGGAAPRAPAEASGSVGDDLDQEVGHPAGEAAREPELETQSPTPETRTPKPESRNTNSYSLNNKPQPRNQGNELLIFEGPEETQASIKVHSTPKNSTSQPETKNLKHKTSNTKPKKKMPKIPSPEPTTNKPQTQNPKT